VIKGVLETSIHRGWSHRYTVYKAEEGGPVVGGGFVFSWVVISSLVGHAQLGLRGNN